MVSEDKENILAGRKFSSRKKEQLSKLAQQATGNDLITLFTFLYEDGSGGCVSGLTFGDFSISRNDPPGKGARNERPAC